ncbi:MAG: hypothetical protein WBP41_06725 [Saprospiraceae bacterium]
MKKYLLLICLFYSWILSGQDAIRVYGGFNLSNVRYHLKNSLTNTDTSYLRSNNYVLPLLGADIDFNISPKFTFTTGIGINFLGSKNYNTDVNIPNLNIDSNLRIGYLRIPLIVNYNLTNGLSLFGGYSFNYSFRKNLNFVVSKPGTFEGEGIYKPIHHALLFGLKEEWKNWSITANYHAGISRIWDTKDFDPDKRAYLTLKAFQFTIGYFIRE